MKYIVEFLMIADAAYCSKSFIFIICILMWIFSTKEFLILVSSSQTLLQNTTAAICSLQPAEYKPVLQCMVHNLLGFCFLCFHFHCFWQKGGGREAQRNPSFYFFPSTVFCHFLFHTGFCSAARNWRELYKNLSVLSFLDAYTQNQIKSKELKYFQLVRIINNS